MKAFKHRYYRKRRALATKKYAQKLNFCIRRADRPKSA